MNRSKTYSLNHWTKLRNAGAVGTMRMYPHTCHVIAQIARDGSLRSVGPYSERYPTFMGDVAAVEVFGVRGSSYHTASNKAKRMCYNHKWIWPWVAGGMEAHMAKLQLWEDAKAGKLSAPAHIVAQAMREFAERDRRTAEHHRRMATMAAMG